MRQVSVERRARARHPATEDGSISRAKTRSAKVEREESESGRKLSRFLLLRAAFIEAKVERESMWTRVRRDVVQKLHLMLPKRSPYPNGVERPFQIMMPSVSFARSRAQRCRTA